VGEQFFWKRGELMIFIYFIYLGSRLSFYVLWSLLKFLLCVKVASVPLVSFFKFHVVRSYLTLSPAPSLKSFHRPFRIRRRGIPLWYTPLHVVIPISLQFSFLRVPTRTSQTRWVGLRLQSSEEENLLRSSFMNQQATLSRLFDAADESLSGQLAINQWMQ
jgi:hypothetical protein